MRLQLIRHATLLIEFNGQRLLIDPMLDDAGARPAIQNSPNPRNNPLVALPIPAAEVVRDVNAVLVTHTHSDHWDAAAAQRLPKAIPLFGQPDDEAKFRSQGFSDVRTVHGSIDWKGITIARTGGQHGKGETGKAMAPVSGFVFSAKGEPNFYIAGDTIWCEEVDAALAQYHPAIVVVNAGAAQFLEGGPITMSADDVIQTCRTSPRSQVVAVHMEAINHCLLTRDDLAFQLEAARLTRQVAIPQDGDWVELQPAR